MQYKTSLLVWLVPATDFFRDQILCCKCVLLIIMYLTSNKFNITHPRDNIRKREK